MSHMSVTMGEVQVHLAGLESVWDGGMRDAYAFYRPHASPAVALAAAMVESAMELQEIGERAPDPPHLLLGDLCLARASRLLAETRDQRLQVGFARAVEHVASAAASGSARNRDGGVRISRGESGGPSSAQLRSLLVAAIGDSE